MTKLLPTRLAAWQGAIRNMIVIWGGHPAALGGAHLRSDPDAALAAAGVVPGPKGRPLILIKMSCETMIIELTP